MTIGSVPITSIDKLADSVDLIQAGLLTGCTVMAVGRHGGTFTTWVGGLGSERPTALPREAAGNEAEARIRVAAKNKRKRDLTLADDAAVADRFKVYSPDGR
jgi:hypothetical protein